MVYLRVVAIKMGSSRGIFWGGLKQYNLLMNWLLEERRERGIQGDYPARTMGGRTT